MKIIINLIAAFALACVSFGVPSKYDVTFIPGIEGYGPATATDLNNLGEVVGFYGFIESKYGSIPVSFIYSKGTVEALQIAGGQPAKALAINDSSQIVGELTTSSSKPHAFSYLNGETTDIGSLIGENEASYAYAINNKGQVVGGRSEPRKPSYDLRPFIFDQGKIIDINLGIKPFPNSAATSINDNYDSNGLGQIIGYLNKGSRDLSQLFGYFNGKVKTYECPDDPNRYTAEYHTSINNVGQFAGYFLNFINQQIHNLAFICNIEDGSYTFIGENGQAADINDAGQVVGTENYYGCNNPFLFESGVKYDLKDLIICDLDLTGIKPIAINNQGQILANTDRGPILLTPQ